MMKCSIAIIKDLSLQAIESEVISYVVSLINISMVMAEMKLH